MLKYVFFYPAVLHTSVNSLHFKWRLKPVVYALVNELMITNVSKCRRQRFAFNQRHEKNPNVLTYLGVFSHAAEWIAVWSHTPGTTISCVHKVIQNH